MSRSLLTRIGDLSIEIKAIEKELKVLVQEQAPALLAVPGCGVLSAALMIGETAGVHRFRDKDAYARFTGTAPVPVWPGASVGKVRLNRGGNRQMNHVLHMIAITQARGIGPGKAYLAKQEARGKTASLPSACCTDASPTSSTPLCASTSPGRSICSTRPPEHQP